jgi:hypothetical protein
VTIGECSDLLFYNYIVACIPISRLQPRNRQRKTFAAAQHILMSKNRRPLLGNGCIKLVPVTTDTRATIEMQLETVFSTVVGAEGL